MRILHTADWHLGKIVNGIHMTEDQSYILNKLIDLIKDIEPDVIIIAGDLYDRAVPPKEAVELLNSVLTKLNKNFQIPVLAISGNHDSPDRLDFASSLLREQKVFIQAKLLKDQKPVILYDDHGPVYFHLIPYIEPEEVREEYGDENIKTHEDAMKFIIEGIEREYNMTERHIFVGHAFLQGGMESDSEERLSMVGGTPYVPAELFKNFTYTAMGHLHQAQRVSQENIRYSGSILKYSFSESNHRKSITVVDLHEAGVAKVKQIELQPKRDLRIIEGYFQEIISEPIEPVNDYLHITLLDQGKLIDPIGKLRKIYPNILRLERKSMRLQNHLHSLRSIKEKREQSHKDLFFDFYTQVTGTEPDDIRIQYFNDVVSQLTKEERGE